MSRLPRIGSEANTLKIMATTGMSRLEVNRAWKAAKRFASADHHKNDWPFVWARFCTLTGTQLPNARMSDPHVWPDGTAVADSLSKVHS
jgi:hypothetical protein